VYVQYRLSKKKQDDHRPSRVLPHFPLFLSVYTSWIESNRVESVSHHCHTVNKNSPRKKWRIVCVCFLLDCSCSLSCCYPLMRERSRTSQGRGSTHVLPQEFCVWTPGEPGLLKWEYSTGYGTARVASWSVVTDMTTSWYENNWFFWLIKRILCTNVTMPVYTYDWVMLLIVLCDVIMMVQGYRWFGTQMIV